MTLQDECFKVAHQRVLSKEWEGAYVYCDAAGDTCLTSDLTTAKLRAVGNIRGFWLFKEGEVGEAWLLD